MPIPTHKDLVKTSFQAWAAKHIGTDVHTQVDYLIGILLQDEAARQAEVARWTGFSLDRHTEAIERQPELAAEQLRNIQESHKHLTAAHKKVLGGTKK